LFWLVLVAAMGCAWWMDRSQLSAGLETLVQHIYQFEGEYAHWNDAGRMIVTDR
jgi:hypothetical protein